MEPVLEFDGLWQSFRPKNRRGGRRGSGERRWALQDFNLTVSPGETVGVVGTNGSGKSTLLRTAAGVYQPDRGHVWVRGRVSSLLDLETGLNRDLTARENLLIGGVLLGLTRAEVRERYDRIVEFSGLDERALNQPLSSFSSGMALRLIFSVVLNSDPTVLLVDEVLAVGDEAFRLQCATRLDELRRSGCGVLLVSHDLELIAKHCTRVVVLDRGITVFVGSPHDALERYRVEASDGSVEASAHEVPQRVRVVEALEAEPNDRLAGMGIAEKLAHRPASAGLSPMRVAMLITSMQEGGAQRQLFNLALGLHRRGDQVLVLSQTPGGRFGDELAAQGVTVDSFDKDHRLDPRYAYRFWSKLRRHSPDVIACYMVDSNVMGMAYRATKPRTRVVMGFRNESPNPWARGLVMQALQPVERRLAPYADALVVNSSRGARYLLEHGYPEAILYQIDNGIDVDLFRPDATRRAATRAEWGVDDHVQLVGLVGRRHQQKGIPDFLEAARRIADRLPTVRFVCIGRNLEADYTAQLFEQAEDLGLVPPLLTWHESYPDMTAAYNAFDLLVNASYQEGLANCIAESLACGTPVVATDVGDSALILADPRRVVEPGSVDQLANAVVAALDEDDVREKIRAGMMHYDLDTMVDRTRALYADILRPRHRRSRSR